MSTWTIPRFSIIPTHSRADHDRRPELTALVRALAPQCDMIIVIDNASDPPIKWEDLFEASMSAAGPERRGAAPMLIRDEEQPPNLSRLWNVGLGEAKAKTLGLCPTWDVAIFNDDAVVPPGWFDAVAGPLREHPTAVVACTPAHGDSRRPALLKSVPDNDLYNRMTPWAFVTKGEIGQRADERLKWWWFDTKWDFDARRAGGVLHVPGPQVTNSRANESTNTLPGLGEQAGRDGLMFEKIEGNRPW